jgi:hypothetical protein
VNQARRSLRLAVIEDRHTFRVGRIIGHAQLRLGIAALANEEAVQIP